MKLRIKGDSLRLRVTPAEMERVLESGCIEETIHFGLKDEERLTYALEHGDVPAIEVRHTSTRFTVIVPVPALRTWANGEDVGIYGSIAVATGRLEIAIEKDWACLDNGGNANEDTFPNPRRS